MKRMRKFIGLAAIAAVLNPLCCCIAGALPMPEPAKASAHSCCSQPQTAAASDKAPAGGCASEDGCAHKQGAYEREASHHGHGLVVAPAATATAQAYSVEFRLSTAISPAWERAKHGPPGRIDSPAWLRSHSFLN